MEEGSCGEREEFMVGVDEEPGEVVPPSFGIQFLSPVSIQAMAVSA